jgi:hypothetical protein
VFAIHASDDVVAGADDVPTFQRVDPTVVVHDPVAMLAWCITVHARGSIVTHNIALPLYLLAMLWRELAQFTVLKSIVRFAVVQRMIAIPHPLSRFNNDWYLAALHSLASLALCHSRCAISSFSNPLESSPASKITDAYSSASPASKIRLMRWLSCLFFSAVRHDDLLSDQ